MPWTAKDAAGFTKAADTQAKKDRWAAVANDALERCLEDGGDADECEASAIRQANSVIAEARGEGLGVGGEPQGDGGVEMCVCPECGATAPHERGIPCTQQACPECGAMMAPQVEEEEGAGAEAVPDDELTEATKTVHGVAYPASAFLVVEDPDMPSTWHLQVRDAEGNPDHRLMGAAYAALTVGYRGNRYEGPQKEEAMRKLKALYDAEDMDLPGEAEPLDLPDLRELLARALAYVDRQLAEQEPEPEPAETEPAEAELAESASGHVIALAEQLPLPGSEKVVPLHLDVALITPGWGNKRDNHYYPREVVERDAGVFGGVKMYETDHRQDEKSTRTWVSTVKEVVGYTDDGAPIGRVSVHDRNFAERLMALAADDLLEKMECSILAAGTARRGEVDGRKGHIVEAITSADSVDWVTRAGAGGRALSLAESDDGGESMEEEKTEALEEQEPLEEVTLQEQQEPEPEPVEETESPEEETPAPAMLEPETVQEMVGATNLPDAAKAKLSEAEYADEDALKAAIAAEVAYLKEVTGSGKPFAQGAGSAPEHKPRTAEQANADWKRILAEVGMPHLAGGN